MITGLFSAHSKVPIRSVREVRCSCVYSYMWYVIYTYITYDIVFTYIL